MIHPGDRIDRGGRGSFGFVGAIRSDAVSVRGQRLPPDVRHVGFRTDAPGRKELLDRHGADTDRKDGLKRRSEGLAKEAPEPERVR